MHAPKSAVPSEPTAWQRRPAPQSCFATSQQRLAVPALSFAGAIVPSHVTPAPAHFMVPFASAPIVPVQSIVTPVEVATSNSPPAIAPLNSLPPVMKTSSAHASCFTHAAEGKK